MLLVLSVLAWDRIHPSMLQVVKAVELLVAAAPASPALCQALLSLVPRFPSDDALCWLLPLLIHTLWECVPIAPVGDWVAVVQVAQQVSPASAAAVARRGAEVHPWSKQLWELHMETSGGCDGVAGVRLCWCS